MTIFTTQIRFELDLLLVTCSAAKFSMWAVFVWGVWSQYTNTQLLVLCSCVAAQHPHIIRSKDHKRAFDSVSSSLKWPNRELRHQNTESWAAWKNIHHIHTRPIRQLCELYIESSPSEHPGRDISLSVSPFPSDVPHWIIDRTFKATMLLPIKHLSQDARKGIKPEQDVEFFIYFFWFAFCICWCGAVWTDIWNTFF